MFRVNFWTTSNWKSFFHPTYAALFLPRYLSHTTRRHLHASNCSILQIPKIAPVSNKVQIASRTSTVPPSLISRFSNKFYKKTRELSSALVHQRLTHCGDGKQQAMCSKQTLTGLLTKFKVHYKGCVCIICVTISGKLSPKGKTIPTGLLMPCELVHIYFNSGTWSAFAVSLAQFASFAPERDFPGFFTLRTNRPPSLFFVISPEY